MKSTKIFALLLVVVMCFTMLASCGLFGKKCDGHVDANDDGKCDKCEADFDDGKEPGPGPDEDEKDDVTPFVPKQAEYNTYTSTMPSNWNELTYQDNNDTQIMSYLGSSFFDFDYKFEDGKKYNADGSINVDGIVKDAFTVNYSAATKLEDVTSLVGAKWGYTDEQKAEGGYAWKITLRDDLQWDDGTAITAADFVYSMEQQLDPNFMNYRGNTFYDTLRLKNAKNYFFKNQEGTYETVESFGYKSNAEAIADGKVIYFNAWNMWGAAGYPDENGNECPEWLAYNDTTVYTGEYKGEPDPVSGAMLYQAYSTSYAEVGAGYGYDATIYVPNTNRDVVWGDVGIYAEGNAIVVCLDKSYSLLSEDGSLSVWAGYYMSSLPLVHQAKYEASKKAPAEGATLWTTDYNTSLEKSASWGPYKLSEFEAGSYYKLVKNDKWYGWNMEEYKNQYNITAINCRKVEEPATQWMGFLAGDYDSTSLTTDNIADYKDSKYVTYSPETGTYGMQLFSDLSVLKGSENNNGILAIQEFRHALNLALNRADVVEKIWPGTSVPCFGLVNDQYYYDIENSPTLDDQGIYRNSIPAMKAVLRAYGFTEDAEGYWSSAELNNLTLEEAYDALTGYNPTLAKQKMKEAIAKLTADAEFYGYDATKDITIVYGSSVDNAKQRERCAYLQAVVDELVKGTSLEGKIKLVFDASAGAGWSDAFRSGATQIGFGYGFSGNPLNPFDIIGAFVNPDDTLNYHAYWDTSSVKMTLTLPECDHADSGKTYTMSLQNWYYCLNGLATEYEQTFQNNWDAGKAPVELRLAILAGLEEIVLNESRSVMLIGGYTGSLLAPKFSHLTKDYNYFMGFGGMRYMVVEHTDAEWEAFIESHNGDLTEEYKKSE